MKARTRRAVVALRGAKVAQRIAEAKQRKKVTNNQGSVPVPTKKALGLLGKVSKTDVLGSYTGRPMDRDEKPTQDADDL
jgi:hypothetical protein